MTPFKDKLFADGLQQIEEVFIFALTYWEQLKESGIWTVAYIIWITGDFIGFIGMYLHSWVKKKNLSGQLRSLGWSIRAQLFRIQFPLSIILRTKTVFSYKPQHLR